MGVNRKQQNMNAEETLFSLELAVNSVRVVPRTLLCRMPAVAFRLLDFPSVIIEQMESREMKQIREAVQRVWDNENDVPNQLEELKDRHGNYEFNKGKSSLFKYNINSLQSHLLNTPLYVMIVDLWSNAPKLVGHCNVALNEIMNEIKADVVESGISVPSVHGIQGRFPLFNLMGSEIGWISLGIRILSLGGNLIPHIPDAALSRRSTVHHPLADVDINAPKSNREGAPSKQYRGKAEVEEGTDHHANPKLKARIVEPESLLIPPKQVEVEVAQPAHDIRPIKSDYVENVDDNGTVSRGSVTKGEHSEASAHQSHPHHSTVFLESEQSSDAAIITNTHIPPPLFFNSMNEPTKERKGGVHSLLQQTIHPQNAHDTWRKSVDMPTDANVSSSSSLGERRELEVHYVIHPPEYHSSPSVRKTLRKTHRDKAKKSMKNPENVMAGKAEVSVGGDYEHDQENVGQGMVEHLRQMPILNALLRELSLLYRCDGGALPPPPIVNQKQENDYHEEKQHNQKQENVQNKPKHDHHKEPEPSPVVKPQTLKTYRHKHRDCVKPPSGVPSSKGWLRQQPAVRRKKPTKLQFKMTNSQKLRLQRHNPDAYQMLEEQERIAEIQFQIRSAQLQEEKLKNSAHQQRSKRTLSARPHPLEDSCQLQERNMSTEILTYQDNISPSDKTENLGYAAGLETYMISADKLVNQEQEHGKKTLQPVPKQAAEYPEQSAPQMLPEKDVSGSEKSVHSISIRLPSALDQEESDDGDSDNDSSAEDSQDDESKAVYVPGFPEEDLEETGAQADTAVSVNDSGRRGMELYSDDFNDSYRFESTGEQELVSIKSSDGSARTSHHSPHGDQRSPSVLSRDEAQWSHSSASSHRTAVSVESPGGVGGTDADVVSKTSNATSKSSKISSTVSSKYPMSVLSIPQPQMSANSPIPLARRSTIKSVAFTHDSASQPPKPKPRRSLERTTSSISDASLLAPDLTLSGNSSAVNTSDLRPDSSDDYQPDGNYSDDFDSDDT